MTRPWMPVGISLIIAALALFQHYRNMKFSGTPDPFYGYLHFFLAIIVPIILVGLGVKLCLIQRVR